MKAQLSDNEDVFALKVLRDCPDKQVFDQEVEMLRRFSNHSNIVTLLAAISCQNGEKVEYKLLFPWAEGDLHDLWKTRQIPERTRESYSRICNQMTDLTDAVKYIHGADSSTLEGEPLYGRHGDLKPENVLWFKKDGKEILVISDLGLSVVNRKTSRSDVPGKNVQVTQTYKAPEREMSGQDGYISRSFDIWTLGALFLDFVIWTLEGWQGVEDFEEMRISPHLEGNLLEIYYNITIIAGDITKGAFEIKPQVQEVCSSN